MEEKIIRTEYSDTMQKAFIDYVCEFEYEKMGIGKPDDVIFLHAPFDLVTEMRNARQNNEGLVNDIHERDEVFMRKVYDNAMFVSEYLSWNMIQCNEGNRMRSIDDIHNDVKKLVLKKIK